MEKFLKIRFDRKCAQEIEKELVCTTHKIEKGTIVMHELEMSMEDPRWNRVKEICIKHASVLPDPIRRISGIFNKEMGDRLPEYGPGYTIIDYYYKYSAEEMGNADYFHVNVPVRPVLDRKPEDEKSIYDFSGECRYCRFGWNQTADLTFKAKSLVKTFPLFRVFGRDEWIMNEEIRITLETNNIQGVEFRPVRAINGQSEIQSWYQFIVKNRIGPCLPETYFGFDPLYTGSKDSNACPLGHTRGLNLLSEIHLSKKQLSGLDIAMTTDYIGGIGAVQVPTPLLIVSKKVYYLLKDKKTKIQFNVVKTK